MSPVIAAHDVSKRFGKAVALDRISFSLPEHTIYGLLGRNGAGKTTLMQILTGQQFASAGRVELFGLAPYENDAVLAQVCFVKESQRYPDAFTVAHALRAAALVFPGWDEPFAQSLVDEFGLPRRRRVRKLSRGMVSALGVIIGLGSQSPITFFDEPYLGLDAVARQLFYDHLLRDFAERPRTVVLSTHLIDEVSDLIEHVLLLDRGALVVDEDADTLRGQVVTVTGPVAAVDAVAASRTELHREVLGPTARATVRGSFDATQRSQAVAAGLGFEPVSLQQLVVRLTTGTSAAVPAGPALAKELSR